MSASQRKTVSSKSTPNDDVSEASTNEAAISEITTPSPNEELSTSTVYPARKSPHAPNPAWQSPSMRSEAASKFDPVECLSLAASGKFGKSGTLPALVEGNEYGTVDIQSMPSAPPTAQCVAAGVTAAAAGTEGNGPVRSSDYMRWLISSVSRHLPTEGRAQLAAAIKEFGGASDLHKPPLPAQPVDHEEASNSKVTQHSLEQHSMNALVDKIKRLCQAHGLNMPVREHAAASAVSHTVAAAASNDTGTAGNGMGASSAPWPRSLVKQEPGTPPAEGAAGQHRRATEEATTFMVKAGKLSTQGALTRPAAARQGAGLKAASSSSSSRAAPPSKSAKRDDSDRLGADTHLPVADSKRRRSSGGAPPAAVSHRPPSHAASQPCASHRASGEVETWQSLVAQLHQTALCAHLTNAVATMATDTTSTHQGVCASHGAAVTVRVVGEARTSSGGYLHRSKSILAFQEEEGGKEVVLVALYVNEFGADSPPPNTGRVYVECIDGVPLRRGEPGAQREALVARIVSAYLHFVRNLGFSFVHFRSPPPHDDLCQIFARRPDEQRVTWTLYMTRWMHRLLSSAQSAGSIHSYTCGAHGSILNFPPTLMTSGHLILEATFGALEARLTSRQNMSVSARRALRDRLFVVRLHTSPPVGMVPAPGGQGAPNTFAALRTGLNKMLLQQRLAFHTMHHALASSQAILRRLIYEQNEQARYQAQYSIATPRAPHAHLASANSHEVSHAPFAEVSHAPFAGSSRGGALRVHDASWSVGRVQASARGAGGANRAIIPAAIAEEMSPGLSSNARAPWDRGGGRGAKSLAPTPAAQITKTGKANKLQAPDASQAPHAPVDLGTQSHGHHGHHLGTPSHAVGSTSLGADGGMAVDSSRGMRTSDSSHSISSLMGGMDSKSRGMRGSDSSLSLSGLVNDWTSAGNWTSAGMRASNSSLSLCGMRTSNSTLSLSGMVTEDDMGLGHHLVDVCMPNVDAFTPSLPNMSPHLMPVSDLMGGGDTPMELRLGHAMLPPSAMLSPRLMTPPQHVRPAADASGPGGAAEKLLGATSLGATSSTIHTQPAANSGTHDSEQDASFLLDAWHTSPPASAPPASAPPSRSTENHGARGGGGL